MNDRQPVVPHIKPWIYQTGFTLIELMVAMTVSLFIIGALITVVLSSASTGRSRDLASDLQTNGRYSMEQVKNELMHAGFVGISSVFLPDEPITVATPPNLPIAVTNACDTTNVGKLSRRIWASNDANPYAGTCIPAASYSTGDVLVVRALDSTPTAGPFSATQVYYHSAYEGGQPFIGPAPPNFVGSNKQTPYISYEMQETVYYISPFTTSAAEVPLVPALYRMRLGNGPAMASELVASGVENFQVRFGVFQTDLTIRYFSADEIDLVNPADWDLVRSVQIWLLMRTPRVDPGYTNTNTYTMGTQAVAVNDGFRRLLLSSVIELRN